MLIKAQRTPDILEEMMAKVNGETATTSTDQVDKKEEVAKTDDDVINNLMNQGDKPLIETEDKKEEVKVEKKAEEVKAEDVTAETKTEEKEEVKPTPVTTVDSLLETEESQEQKEPEELVKLKEKAARFEEYQEILTDPLVVAFAEYRKNGGNNYREFLNGTLGQDYSSLNDEHAYKQYLSEFNQMNNPAEIEEQWEIFNANTDSFKAAQLKNIRATFENKQIDSLSKFGLSLKDSRKEAEKQYQNHMLNGEKAITSSTSKLLNKDWNGMTITSDMIQKINDRALVEMGRFNFFDPEKGYNTRNLISYAMNEEYGAKMLEIARDKARNDATHQTLKTIVKPEKNTHVDNASVNLNSEKTEKQKSVDDFIANQW